jgi:hypothetical protein
MGPTYVAVETKFTSLAGSGGLLVGGQVGWVFDPHLRIGFGGTALVSGPSIAGADDQATSLKLAYGGLRAAYVLRPTDVVHLAFATMVGIGSVATVTQGPRMVSPEPISSPVLLALEPEVELEFNLSRSVRLAAIASYRYLSGPDVPLLDSAAISGVSGGMVVKVGAF